MTDFDGVSTVAFRILYYFVVLCLDRSRVVRFNVTTTPTASFVDGSGATTARRTAFPRPNPRCRRYHRSVGGGGAELSSARWPIEEIRGQ